MVFWFIWVMARSWTFLTLQIWTCEALLRVLDVHTKTAQNTQQRHIAHRGRIDWGLQLTQTYPGSFLRFVTKDDGWDVWQCSHVYIFVTGAKQHSPSHHIGLRRHEGIQKYFPFNQSMEVIGDTLWWRALTVTFSLDYVWVLNPENALYIKIIISWLTDECSSELAFITCEVTWRPTDQLPSRHENFQGEGKKKWAIINLGPGFDSNWVKLHDASLNCIAFKIYRSIILIKISNWKMLNAYYYHFYLHIMFSSQKVIWHASLNKSNDFSSSHIIYVFIIIYWLILFYQDNSRWYNISVTRLLWV